MCPSSIPRSQLMVAVFGHVVAVVAASAAAVPRHRRAAAVLEPSHLHGAASPLDVGHVGPAAVDARGAGRVHPGLPDGRRRARWPLRPTGRRRVRRAHIVVAPIVGRGHRSPVSSRRRQSPHFTRRHAELFHNGFRTLSSLFVVRRPPSVQHLDGRTGGRDETTDSWLACIFSCEPGCACSPSFGGVGLRRGLGSLFLRSLAAFSTGK